jgi:hypothetical protein
VNLFILLQLKWL